MSGEEFVRMFCGGVGADVVFFFGNHFDSKCVFHKICVLGVNLPWCYEKYFEIHLEEFGSFAFC